MRCFKVWKEWAVAATASTCSSTISSAVCAVFTASLVASVISVTIFEILPAEARHWSANLRICVATTENPLPAAPARAASIEAFKESRFVSSAMSLILLTIWPMFFECTDNSLIVWMTLSVMSVVDFVFAFRLSMLVNPELIATCVEAAMLPISLVLSFTTLILVNRLSISFRQSVALSVCSPTPVSISCTEV